MRKAIGLFDADGGSLISKVGPREECGRLGGKRCHAGSLLRRTCLTKTPFYAECGTLPPFPHRLYFDTQAIAAHESPRTTKLYARTADVVIMLDEVERITI